MRNRRWTVIAVGTAMFLSTLAGAASAAPPQIPTTLTITAEPNPAWVDDTVTITFQVSPIPNGGFITEGGPGIPVDPTTGKATIQRVYPSAGDWEVLAWYQGTDVYSRSDIVTATVVVRQHPVTTTMTLPDGHIGRGDGFDVVVDLGDAPDGGVVQIQDMTFGNPGPTLVWFPVSGPQPMTIPVPGLEPRTYNLRALYGGTARYATAASTTQVLDVYDRVTTMHLDTGPDLSPWGAALQATVSFDPVPDDGGLVRLRVDGSDSGWFAMDWTTGVGVVDLPWMAPGPHTIVAQHRSPGDPVPRWSPASVSVTHTVSSTPSDTTPPMGSVSIDGGAAFTASASVMLATDATDGESGLSVLALSNDGNFWITRPYAANQSWTLPATNGTRTVHAKWQDVTGNWSGVSTDTIFLDTIAPAATPPRRGFVTKTALSGGSILTRILWSGSDVGSGIERYELHRQTDGGAWTSVSTKLTSPSATPALATERTYRFRARAVDQAGNVGSWSYGDTFRVSRFSEGNSRISYSGTWSTSSYPVFWGGVAKASSKSGSRASITFTGRSVALVASMGPTRGKADVYVNGSKIATVDLYSATSKHQQVVWAGSWTTAASRTVTIRVVGTSGRPRVDLDAFVTAN